MNPTSTSPPLPAEVGRSSEVPDLLQAHFDALHHGSGIAVDVIRERGYRSILGKKELLEHHFGKAQARPTGLLLPHWGPDGRNGLCVYRPDVPRVDARGRELKYELPIGKSARLDVPPRCCPMVGNPQVPLWLTEGQKKGDALAGRGLCAAALLGVWNWKGKNDFGGVVLLADFDYLALNGRTVNIVFDSDLQRKQAVREALDRLVEHLQRKGAIVNRVYLPEGADGEKNGVDDFLLTRGVADLEALVSAPKPAVTAAVPMVELLGDAPASLTRPLALVDGRAYAATWLWTRRTMHESLNKGGEVVRHDPPLVTTSRDLFVVRGDGTVFGPGGDQPLDALAVEVKLAEPPREGKTWRTAGVTAYRQGRRPEVTSVFRRLVAVYDYFIDFGQSFAEQAAMCELSACLSLVTWLAPAFTVLGYPWPNGERGTGKTKWGICWAYTSYLGEVLLSSGSFAALRDLAAYGAALLFDDAEVLGDPRRSDPQKRELFLAGNRRGASVALKELGPDGRTWLTRWVPAFCPRGFTAINLPDPVLASRSILLPLARTVDTRRGNRDPADLKRWPCDQPQLQDDLWMLALWLLPEAERIWAELDDEDGATGREFEPWRALVATARLLDRHHNGGAAGECAAIERRLRTTMAAYQEERSDLLDNDRTVAVVKAIVALAFGPTASDVLDVLDVLDILREGVEPFTAQHIADAVKEAAEGTDGDTEWVNARRIGHTLKRLRLRQERESSARRRRFYKPTKGDVLALGRAYGVVRMPKSTDSRESVPPSQNVRNVRNVRNVQTSEAVGNAADDEENF